MPGSRRTKLELQEENANLRSRLAEARDLIDEALGLEELDEDDDEDDDEDEDEEG